MPELIQISRTFNLTNHSDRHALSVQIKADLDEYCKQAYDDGPRSHLGASEIGHKCERFLWYKFRWCVKEVFNGRMQRLFNRGQREESRFKEWLAGIGCTLLDTGDEQRRIVAVAGHFGGSRDGAILLCRYGLADPILIEFKTNGTGAGFDKLSEGVQEAKPLHWAQMCVYGVGFACRYALYLNINKNDDDIHAEIVELDFALGQAMVEKGRRVISSPVPPAKLSESATWYECKFCAAREVCHFKAAPLKNCRSCKNAAPVENGQWNCSRWQAVIPTKEAILEGCNQWTTCL